MSTPPAAQAGGGGAFTLVAGDAGRLAAQGPLTFASARGARELGRRALQDGSAGGLLIDCGAVSSADSAGLVVLLDWLALAKAAGRTLRFAHLPPGLAALGRISEVQELLERGV
ncbi:MAG TPA: STAS domain-containing protein [Steroidobacteraceae bacterium]|jgi:phospholipid transport system transporter-binding protein|nr:STAS domain-containing protein [Steroidobacteraceae bacterium]